MIEHINTDNFESVVLNSDKLVLVDFFATWCGPCQMLSPVLEELSRSRAEVVIAKVDIDRNMSIAKNYGIQVVPTLILFKNGKVVNKTEGYMDKNELSDFINEHID